MEKKRVFIDGRELVADLEKGTGFIVMELKQDDVGVQVTGVNNASIRMMEAAISAIQSEIDKQMAKRPSFTEFMVDKLKTDPQLKPLVDFLGEEKLMEMIREVDSEPEPEKQEITTPMERQPIPSKVMADIFANITNEKE